MAGRTVVPVTEHMIEETAKVLFKLGLTQTTTNFSAAEHILRFGLNESTDFQPDGYMNKYAFRE